MDYKKYFEDKQEQASFIKTVTRTSMPGDRKAALNRKGNILYNSGRVEEARRIFLTTGYSDGLVRVGDYYRSNGRDLDALRMYWIAPDRNKAEPIIMRLAALIETMLDEEGENPDER